MIEPTKGEEANQTLFMGDGEPRRGGGELPNDELRLRMDNYSKGKHNIRDRACSVST